MKATDAERLTAGDTIMVGHGMCVVRYATPVEGGTRVFFTYPDGSNGVGMNKQISLIPEALRSRYG